MSYEKTSPQPASLAPGETAVTLDDGSLVAVMAVSSVQDTSGNPVIAATARAINADGTDKPDALGQPVRAAWRYTSFAAEVANLGHGDATAGMAALQKACLMAVLGEDTAPMWQDPIHYTTLQEASIRTHLASAAHAGQVDVGTLL